MLSVALSEIVADTGGTFVGDADVLVTGVASDSRNVRPGDVFVAITGERVDANVFAADVLSAGALAVVTDNPDVALSSGASEDKLVIVESITDALGKMARGNLERVRASYPLRVLALTGSVGKTTTKDLLAAIFEAVDGKKHVIAPAGSFNNEYGLPFTVLRVDEQTRTLVLEMGADDIGNISYLTSIAQPDASEVLIVARAHLGHFGSLDRVAEAKSEIVTGTRKGGAVVLNADDSRVAAMSHLAAGPVTYFSRREQTDVFATDEHIDSAGHASFILHAAGEQRPVTLKLVGQHNVANALGAAALALTQNVDLTTIAAQLSSHGPASPHRMDVQTLNGVQMIDDSYNANPDSMAASIRALAAMPGAGRKIAVLSDMLELGETEREEHRALAEQLVHAGVDLVIGLGSLMEQTTRRFTQLTSDGEQVSHDGKDQPENAGAPIHDLSHRDTLGQMAAQQPNTRAISVSDVDHAQNVLTEVLRPGDTLLIKGSHGSGAWRVAESVRAGLVNGSLPAQRKEGE
ncbi:MAG: UDP-N-acetylmuramoyl-tripeptide--D-alanyl-D-alanine ligase [Actinomycetaceae bacterium]|nr:UDP-N-acetylmuramoyl-tripeptide--D-alanyl-D-alanine ligase [Actinomycetaceae bacterium]MDY6083033.1 UDP-N-acetylmuramoyl-tripeptide--D-alanyl-D-alanine ligase [Actinomycetaceae bacterium]